MISDIFDNLTKLDKTLLMYLFTTKTKGKKMTKRKLSVLIAKVEGKKSQVAIGNIMEILTILENLLLEDIEKQDILDSILGRVNKMYLKKRKKQYGKT